MERLFNFVLSLFYQGGDPPVSLALKRTLEVTSFARVFDFVNLVAINLFSTSLYKFRFFVWSRKFPSY